VEKLYISYDLLIRMQNSGIARKKWYSTNMRLTKQAIKQSVNEDQLIVQAISNMQELQRAGNMLTKRLREWYAWYYPELVRRVESNEKFVDMVLVEKKRESSMGADFKKHDVAQMQLLAKEIKVLQELQQKHEKYLETVMRAYCPNVLYLAGTTLAAELIHLAKGLKHLAMLPASTIQLLGAEKALFRHLRTGARSPKYGILFAHQYVQTAERKLRGKAARMLADKLALCARIDYFKGEFKADMYKKDLEGKL
jgi:nucleolar protein 56